MLAGGQRLAEHVEAQGGLDAPVLGVGQRHLGQAQELAVDLDQDAVVVDALAVTGYDDVFDTAPAGARRGDADSDTRPRAGTRGDGR